MIVIQLQGHVLSMEQHTCRYLVIQIPTTTSIHLSMSLGADHSVQGNRILCLWFEILHIDLSCNGLITIQHRRRTLAHLNSLHPWTRDILHTKSLCQTTDVWGVLRQHLHIGSTQAQQPDLLSSSSCI